MAKIEEIRRLNMIMDDASKLSVHEQEYILATIRGMLLARDRLLKKRKHSRKPPER